ncbi:TetR/AcrR family transcriptional regulator [Enterococcus sp. UD-01]|jgi:AcrR family transcriptional regulator|uniref:TetR/AcrR family transcriptional regulator n=1 Tax=Enterococcus sp. UD-01 TaxID=3373911 RepID=UPI0038359147
MYHIKEDKRSRNSLKLILQAFDKCLEVHPFTEMTITELCYESTVSRATFYRLFDRLEDIITYKCELLADEFSESVTGCTLHEIQLKFFTKWMDNIALLKLIEDLHKTEIIYNCHKKHLKQIKTTTQFVGLSNKLTDYHFAILTSTLVTSLIIWCNHGCKETANELVASINTALTDIAFVFDNKKS